MDVDNTDSLAAPNAPPLAEPILENTQNENTTATTKKTTAAKKKTTKKMRKAFAHVRARILCPADVSRTNNPRQIQVFVLIIYLFFLNHGLLVSK
jgi:hypothetical protein